MCIFEAFDMEKFFNKEGLIDTLHTMYTQGKIAKSDCRMWFYLNNKTKISVLTPLGETDQATIMNGIGKGSKLDLNMTRYIHGEEWNAKFLEGLRY